MATDRQTCDIAILGGGLAGGLIAYALHREPRDLDVVIIEAGDVLGGNHIWSFFESDVDEAGAALLEPFVSHRWNGYEVRFPAHGRNLDTGYRSIRSADFDAGLRKALPESAILTGAIVAEADAENVTLESGERIEARGVIDCRGAGDLALLNCGWQKFVGVELEVEAPHGLDRPIVMDATVEQIDGYRFVYSLPLGECRIFVEDTYYSDGPSLNAEALEKRCLDYAAAQGWQVANVVHREKGVLPVVKSGGKFGEYWQSGGHAAKAGVRAGLFQPVTGYSLPDAVRTAQLIAAIPDLSAETLQDRLFAHAAQRWREGRFYRMLDTMMFDGAGAEDRYKILERFYRLSPALISRFYAGRSTLGDKLRLVSGKPPIPVGRGIAALMGSGKQESA